MKTSDIGVIGMGVMGSNLALNLADNKFEVSVYNRPHKDKNPAKDFVEKNSQFKNLRGFDDIGNFVDSLASPKKIIIMVKAGEAVDQVIKELLFKLKKGDIIIDTGNSDFSDTQRREAELEKLGIKYAGVGVSGGEEGARYGASVMVGSSEDVWNEIKKYMLALGAKLADGSICAARVGSGGAGHFVKAVHNGIEYADMQLISEVCQILKVCGKFSADDISKTFARYNLGKLESYLVEITSKIFAKKDSDGTPLIDKIRDEAAQKGTGKIVIKSALDAAQPASVIAEAVFARFVSAMRQTRADAQEIFDDGYENYPISKSDLAQKAQSALFIAKAISYAQGFSLLKSASDEFGWQLDLAKIAEIWRGGCIIRAAFLENIALAFRKNPKLNNLLFDDFFAGQILWLINELRQICSTFALSGIGACAHFSALAYFDNIRVKNSGANLIQAMRDFFGAHTYERIDSDFGKAFHTDWQ